MTNDKKKRCFVFGAAEQNALRLANFIPAVCPAPTEGDFLIAADGGLSLLRAFHLTPNVILGDFDSCDEPPKQDGNTEILSFPPEKDDTDALLCVKRAISEGCGEIVLLGCLGGSRFDHTVATLQTLTFGAKQGVKITALGDDGTVMTALHNGVFPFPSDCKGYFSVFAADGECNGVSIVGAKYPLSDAVLTPSFPLGVSNAFKDGETATVGVENGTLWITWKIN